MEEDAITTHRTPSKWRSVKQLLCLRSIACCGSMWSNHPHPMSLPQEEPEPFMYSQDEQISQQQQQEISPDLQCLLLHHQNSRETNLASALAAERQLRAATSANSATLLQPIASPSETISLIGLLEAKDREEKKVKIGSRKQDEEEGLENGCHCCVCMGRRKGAAFIPCGHTFCRMCARELWINRGSCPLCNRNIIEILDIF